MAADAVWAGIPSGQASFEETSEDLSGDLTGGGMTFLRLGVRGTDEKAVGRAFSGAVVETSLSSFPGIFFTSAPSGAQAVAHYWPTTIAASEITPVITYNGTKIPSSPPTVHGKPAQVTSEPIAVPAVVNVSPDIEVPLWVLIGGRSGDKGGDANVGLWADSDEVAYWLHTEFHVEQFRAALPEADPYQVDRYALPNLRAVNFVVHGILGWGVASNLRLDTQAKGLAELLRSRTALVPASLVAHGKPAERAAVARQGMATKFAVEA
jgi:hypothetical protein